MTDFDREDYSNYRLSRAKETIQEVQTHVENVFWNIAINRIITLVFMQ